MNVKFSNLKFLKIRFWNFKRLKAGFEPINLWSQNINLMKNHISSSINLPKKSAKISSKISKFCQKLHNFWFIIRSKKSWKYIFLII